ncbi:unnamed protein product, partial [Discosporangium mesarthrocarpum]
ANPSGKSCRPRWVTFFMMQDSQFPPKQRDTRLTPGFLPVDECTSSNYTKKLEHELPGGDSLPRLRDEHIVEGREYVRVRKGGWPVPQDHRREVDGPQYYAEMQMGTPQRVPRGWDSTPLHPPPIAAFAHQQQQQWEYPRELQMEEDRCAVKLPHERQPGKLDTGRPAQVPPKQSAAPLLCPSDPAQPNIRLYGAPQGERNAASLALEQRSGPLADTGDGRRMEAAGRPVSTVQPYNQSGSWGGNRDIHAGSQSPELSPGRPLREETSIIASPRGPVNQQAETSERLPVQLAAAVKPVVDPYQGLEDKVVRVMGYPAELRQVQEKRAGSGLVWGGGVDPVRIPELQGQPGTGTWTESRWRSGRVSEPTPGQVYMQARWPQQRQRQQQQQTCGIPSVAQGFLSFPSAEVSLSTMHHGDEGLMHDPSPQTGSAQDTANTTTTTTNNNTNNNNPKKRPLRHVPLTESGGLSAVDADLGTVEASAEEISPRRKRASNLPRSRSCLPPEPSALDLQPRAPASAPAVAPRWAPDIALASIEAPALAPGQSGAAASVAGCLATVPSIATVLGKSGDMDMAVATLSKPSQAPLGKQGEAMGLPG